MTMSMVSTLDVRALKTDVQNGNSNQLVTNEYNNLDPNSTEYQNWKLGLIGNKKNMLRSSIVNDSILSNEYIGASLNSSGAFTIGTTGGNPNLKTDDNQRLLYGYPCAGTSYTTVRVNGKSYVYSTNNSKFDSENSQNTSNAVLGNINVEQKISLIKNTATGREDVAEIKYTLTNKTNKPQQTGLRIMMDTMLGGNDAAPFRVPQYGSITTETEFEGKDIPQIWQAFDSLTNPSVIAQGRFYKNDLNKPDKVQFTNWNSVLNTNWGYNIRKNV